MKSPEADSDQDVDLERADQAIIRMVGDTCTRLTPLTLRKYLRQHMHLSDKAAGVRIRDLIEREVLCYVYDFGTSFIDLNFSKPVQISDHFVLTPPGYTQYTGYSDCIHMIISPGISFGSGRHPTTRLCLKAIDRLAFETGLISGMHQYAADIGTGSGILAMALCRVNTTLQCIAYEIDPVSLSEALKNIHLNHLSHRIQLREDSIETAETSFSIICANLRLPTLKQMARDIQHRLLPGGVLVLSGIRPWEKSQLMAVYKESGLDLLWQEDETDWSCLVMGQGPDV